MEYNVAQLLKGPTGGQRRYHLSEEIKNLDPDLDPVRPLEGWITLMRTSQGILVSGTLSTALQMECRRCLEPCEVEVELELEEEFRPTVAIGDAPVDVVPEDDRDEALTIDEHHILDLAEVIRQGMKNVPDNPDLAEALGLSLIRQQKKEEALPWLAEASRLDPNNTRFAYVHAVALHSMGKGNEAIDRLVSVHQRFPDRTIHQELQSEESPVPQQRRRIGAPAFLVLLFASAHPHQAPVCRRHA